jgi:hypothetical protein
VLHSGANVIISKIFSPEKLAVLTQNTAFYAKKKNSDFDFQEKPPFFCY